MLMALVETQIQVKIYYRGSLPWGCKFGGGFKMACFYIPMHLVGVL
jgi:hypothetical protein